MSSTWSSCRAQAARLGATNDGRFLSRIGAAAETCPSARLPRRPPQIVREGEPPSQAVSAIRNLIREALLVLVFQWPMVSSDHRHHNLGRSGRGAAALFPHWVQNRRKNGVKRGQLGTKTGPKVCKTYPWHGQKRPGAGHGIPRGGNFRQPIFPVLTQRLRCSPAHILPLCSVRPGRQAAAHCLQFL